MSRNVGIVVLVSLGGALAWGIYLYRDTYWSGNSELTVVVSSSAGLPKWVYCHPFATEADANHFLKILADLERPPAGYRSVLADPFDGGPVTLSLWLGGRNTLDLGKSANNQHDRYLLVVSELADGKRVGKVVAIPNYRDSKEVLVSLP